MTVDSSEPGLTIGDVAARTGVSVTTLRAWEMRYGFPVPTRLASGHRRYRIEDVATIERLERDRAGGLSLAAAMARARREAAASAPSIFAGLRARYPDLVFHVLGKRAMYAMSRAIEDECLAAGGDAVVIGSFQRERFYRESERRWRELARTADAVIALAEFSAERHRSGQPVEVAIPPASALAREWAIVCDGPGAAAVLAGWEQPRRARAADLRRRFEAIWSTDAEVVREASRIGLALAAEHSSRPLPVGLDDLPAGRGRPRGRAAPHHRTDQSRRGLPRMSVTIQTTEEHVVLADAHGRPAGTAPKASVHHRETPLHLAFSCHVIDSSGRVLLARRAAGKRTWPATWSNACCGHPQLGETLREAVVRRLADELGLAPRRLGLAIPDFAYRAVMEDGTTEHELCPVVVAEVEGEPSPNRAEVDAVQWVAWDELRHRADAEPLSLSPWSVLQIEGLAALAPSPRQWLEHSPHGGLLDHPVGRPAPRDDDACSIEQALAAARGPVEERLLAFVRAAAVRVRRRRPRGRRARRRGPPAGRAGRQAAAPGLRALGPRRHRRAPRRPGGDAWRRRSSSSTPSPCSTTT